MPRREPGIETRKDADGRDQWRGSVTDPENRNRKLRGEWTYNFAEAKGWRTQMLAKIDQAKREGKRGADVIVRKIEQPTVLEASTTFLAGIKKGIILSNKGEPYAAATVRGYEGAFRDWINPEIGKKRTDQLRRSEVQRLVDAIAAVRAPSTVRNIAHAMCALYTYLLPRNDELLHDPTHGLILPKAGKPRQRFAEPEEILTLLGALDHDDDLAIPYAMAFMEGLRNAEIRVMPVDHIDLDAGWMKVAYSLDPVEGFKGPKSYSGVRHIPIFHGMYPYLERQIERVKQRGPIVASTEDTPGTLLLPSNRNTKFGARTFGTTYKQSCMVAWGWERRVKDPTKRYPTYNMIRTPEALEPIGIHEARHSFATALVRAGYEPKQVQEWVGHAQFQTTYDIYVKPRGRTQDARELTGLMEQHMQPRLMLPS